MRRRHRARAPGGRATVRLVAGVSVVTLAVLVGSAVPQPSVADPSAAARPRVVHAPTAASPVVTQTLPAAYDPVAFYDAQTACDPKPKPGTRALAGLITRTYGRNQVIGITRACRIGGVSEHKEGRALDWMTSIRNRTGRANARAFLTWLLGPDANGVLYGNATRLGVMYVGWNNRYWASYATDRGWAELKGCFSKPGRGNDTICHRNHMHISLSWDGASGRTSLWDGSVLTPYCPSAWSNAFVIDGGRSADVVAVPAVRVLNTRLAQGLVQPAAYGPGGSNEDWWREDTPSPAPSTSTPLPDPSATPTDSPTPSASPTPTATPVPDPTATPVPSPTAPVVVPCRVAAGGWRGQMSGVLTKVTGQGGVPEIGVAAVAVTVTALGSTAPAFVSVWAPGMESSEVIASVRMNGRASGSAIVPVASDGTIALGTSAGATDLTVDVTGYYLAGDQPNITATSYAG
jgi:hypothetical protein